MKFDLIARHAVQSLVPNFIRNIYLMLKYKCIIDLKATIYFPKNIVIGKGTLIRRSIIIAQNKITIGKSCIIENYVEINSKTGEIKIGDNTRINSFCVIYGNGGISIGKNVAIAPGVKLLKNHLIPPITIDSDFEHIKSRPTIIEDKCWIGADCIIMDGVTIGSCSIVGANSFVNKNIPPLVVAAGTPAKILKNRT